MTWFFIALIGPILYSFANHTDKYLISRYSKGGAVGSLIIFSSIFSIVALPIVIFFHPSVLDISPLKSIALSINGMLVVIAILCYFYALRRNETSLVVPFFQTVPIFAFILGYFILGETITPIQGIASLIIILGAITLSFELGLSKIRFKKDVVILMLTASLLYAVNGVVFKLIAIDNGFWLSTFWGLIGKIILGFGFFTYVPIYRGQFMAMVRENKTAVLGLNSLSETLSIGAEAITQYATLFAPVALVLLVNSFQPLFVFVIAILLTQFFPEVAHESIRSTQITQKIIGIGLIMGGSYFIMM